jgi:hypothetical protein
MTAAFAAAVMRSVISDAHVPGNDESYFISVARDETLRGSFTNVHFTYKLRGYCVPCFFYMLNNRAVSENGLFYPAAILRSNII